MLVGVAIKCLAGDTLECLAMIYLKINGVTICYHYNTLPVLSLSFIYSTAYKPITITQIKG